MAAAEPGTGTHVPRVTTPESYPKRVGPLQAVPASVWVILAASLVLKLILLVPAAGLVPWGDEQHYLSGAGSIAAGHGLRYPTKPHWGEAHWPPIMPYAYAACRIVLGERWYQTGVRCGQIVVSLIAALLVYALTRRLFHERAAVVATALVAFYPTLVAFTHYFYSETLMALFITLFVTLLAEYARRQRFRWVFAGGLAVGLGALTKDSIALYLPALALWTVFFTRGRAVRRIGGAGVLLAGAALVVAPWTIRNTLRYDRFLLLSTNVGEVFRKNLNFWEGENYDLGQRERRRAEFRDWWRRTGGRIAPRNPSFAKHPVDRMNEEVRGGLRFIAEHPGLVVWRMGRKWKEFMNPTSPLVYYLRCGMYTGLPPPSVETLVVLTMASFMVVTALAIVGFCVRRPDAVTWLVVAVLASHVLVHVLTISGSRYRVPIMPLLMPYAAAALVQMPALLRVREHWRTWVVAVPVLLHLILVWIEYAPYSF